MNMKKTKPASRAEACRQLAEESFICQTGPEEWIEIRLSIASVPLLGPPPRPKHFQFSVSTPAGMPFRIHGSLAEDAVPLIGQPAGPGNSN